MSDIDYSKELAIFTDGSALGNQKNAPAGCAVYIPCNKTLISRGIIGTNNQAELEAIRYGLWFMKNHVEEFKEIIQNSNIYFLSDSEYSINAITGKNKVKMNENKIMACKILVRDIEKHGYKINFVHVMAHTGKTDFISYNNNIVDIAAKKRAMEMKNRMNTCTITNDK